MHCKRQDSEFYRNIIEHFVDDLPWIQLGDTDSPTAVAATAAEPSRVAEVRLNHLYTDAELYCRLPDPGEGAAARVVLYQPLDSALDTTAQSSDNGFVDAVASAHKTIASVYASEYVTPIADQTVILEAQIPFRYTDQKVYSMMTAITATALRVQRLHQELQETVAAVGETLPDDGVSGRVFTHKSSVKPVRQR